MPRCLIIACLFLGFTLPSAWCQEKVFRAGAYAQNINPLKYPVSVNGGMQDRTATSAADPLHARCLVLDDGRTRLAFAVCDSCMIPREITDEAKRLASKATGIPSQNILISATHTHTAPTLSGVFQSEPNPEYIEQLKKQIAEGIEKANARLVPAKIGWGVGKDETQLFNRRWKMKPGTLAANPFGKTDEAVRMNPGYLAPGLIEPAGPIDPNVSLLSIQTRRGQPIAVLANYSLHYVGNVPSLSADYFAVFADKMKEHVGGDKDFVGIMSNGTSGDINNVNYGKAAPGKQGPYEQARLVAASVARAAFEAYKKIEHKDWVPLAATVTDLELGVRLPGKEDLARAEEILAKAKAAGKKSLITLEEIYARETVLLSKYPPKVWVLVQALRIGDLGIAATPCETFVEIGLEIKKKSPMKHTFTIELANGYNGYLPTPKQHEWGGYETWRARSSYLEANASVAITKGILDLFGEIAR
ncbi:MAG: hypothetical protein L0Y72_31845 [Gemmataceae bacterium]|nr:hypothetical protein [Gemmataceae bacterium]MCI0743647.1 hypothetical protein [Gemmataceae bacterium]